MHLPDRLTIRLQLLGLFGLLMLAGGSVLVLGEVERQQHRSALAAINDDSLVGLRRVKAISDAYGLDEISTAFRVRNNLLDWDDGARAVDEARARVEKEWAALNALPHSEQDGEQLREIGEARVRADIAVLRLRTILARKDIGALGRFADTELFPAMDPVTDRLKRYSDGLLMAAQQSVVDENQRSWNAALVRIGITLSTLLLVAWLGRTVLRNIYRGVESLTALSSQMLSHDYAAEPKFRPEGELGEVLDGFLAMRREVRRYETEINYQLARTEEVRAILQRSEEFQRSLFAAAQVAVMSFDLEGRFSSFNPFAEKLTGYTAAEMIGQRNIDRVLLVEEAQEVAERLSAALGRDVPPNVRMLPLLLELGVQAQEWTLVRKDGTPVPVLLAISAMHDEGGHVIGHLCIATDLTRIKELEQALRASEHAARGANRAKSDFLAAMSHEIRTPMIGVTGMLEVLAHGDLDPEQRRNVTIIQQSAQSLLRIIGDILDFSKVEAGRMELSPTTISLQQLLQSVVANFSGAASSQGLTLSCRIDSRVAPAHVADGLRLRQILANFLSNALKFTEQGFVQAVLEWRGRDIEGENLCFAVIDTGIGVSAEQQSRLFQPFSQAEGSTTRRFGGTGLGLVISRRLAELMGGEVTMQSMVGAGTTMRLLVCLPVGDVADIEPAPGDPRAQQMFQPRPLPDVATAEAERSLVLVVDDHPTNRLVVGRQLALAGYASESAEDGEQGLERWRSGRFALVLSDVHMPIMDGYQMVRALRAEEAQRGLPHTPVIALTAATLQGESERAMAAGMDDYLPKPVGIPQLAACLHKWLPHTIASTDPAPVPVPAARTAETPVAAASPSQERAHDAPRPLDPEVLAQLTGGDPDEARALLLEYLEATDVDLSGAEQARTAGDLPQLARQAHKIKGAARLVGAEELAAIAAELERAAQADGPQELQPLAAQLQGAVDRLRLHIAERYPG